VGAADFDGVGVAALGRQAGALVPAYPELLGDICVSGVHEQPA
jgi:hypothetical protein